MILICPQCETQYFAEDSTFGDSGRTVKCAACNHAWFVGPSNAATKTAQPIGAHETYRHRVRERLRQNSRMTALLAWLGTSVFTLMLITGLYLFRNSVVAAWPQSASAYGLFGLTVNGYSLSFTHSGAQRLFDGTVPILEVKGEVQNISRTDITSPSVRVKLLDDQGNEVFRTFAAITPKRLRAGEKGAFSARIDNPPFESFELELSFVRKTGKTTMPMSNRGEAPASGPS